MSNNDNVIQFPRRGNRNMDFWNILAQDPQELADFQYQLDMKQELLPELSREELISWFGAGPAPFPV